MTMVIIYVAASAWLMSLAMAIPTRRPEERALRSTSMLCSLVCILLALKEVVW